MFKLAVFSLKDIVRYLFCLVIAIAIIYMVNRYFFYYKKDSKKINIFEFVETKAVGLIDECFPPISKLNNKNIDKCDELLEEEDFENSFLTDLINTQISIAKKDINKNNSDEKQKSDVSNDIEEDIIKNNEKNIEENLQNNSDDNKDIKEKIDTEIVTKNPLADAYTDIYENVKIKNETGFTLDESVLDFESLNINNKSILIFHTHTCESYTSSDLYPYTPTGSYRTTDLNYSVSRVGDELENNLKSYGFYVRHNKTYHDYPAYTGSYSRSLSTVQSILNEEKYDIIIDLHRDAIGSRPDYAPTVKIGEEYAAQVMFVIGSNGGGLYHPNWISNLKFAVKIQNIGNAMYPGFFKPIIFRNSRYNQHLGKAACIIEVGSTGNTLEQTLTSMKYLANVFNAALEK